MTVPTGNDVPITPGSEPYWEATRRHELRIAWCATCSRWVHYPRPRCPTCLGTDLTWRDPGTDFRVYSWAQHRGTDEAPGPVVVLVDVADGLRLVSNVIDGIDGIHAGARLELTWRDLDDGRAVPIFRLSPT